MYLWPPRPENKITPELLPMLEAQGFVATLKKNGTCTVISYDASTGEFEAWTRHKEPHKAWAPDLNSPCLRRLKELKGGLYVFVGELLHSKGVGHKDTLYLFDILRANGEDLVGKTFLQRHVILRNLWSIQRKSEFFDYIDDRLWLSNPILKNFSVLFKSLDQPEDEGLVLKDPNSKLEPCWKPSNNQGWQIKCRKGTKNYGF